MKPANGLKVFILEDDGWCGAILEHPLSMNPDFQVHKFENENDFLKAIHDLPDLVILDYALSEMDGNQVINNIKEISPETEMIIISGQKDIASAVNVLKTGAIDYIVKDQEANDRLWNLLVRLREIKDLRKEVASLKIELKKTYDFSNNIIGQSEPIKKVFGLIQKAILTNITISITGETGTGKEMVAKSIHYHSNRQKHNFVAINVAGIPRDLLEAELFGYEKGAFTGAVEKRIGKLEEANKGTIFLDEIGEMDILLQAKLLRVLQEREIVRIGGNSVIPIDVRVIIATQRNLLEEVKEKKFREDLYYRLMGLPIEIPPLRERANDILVLAKHFLKEFCTDNKIEVKQISPAAFQKLRTYSFPGNVRELKSLIELATVMSDGSVIEENDLNVEIMGGVSSLLTEENTLREYELKIIKYFMEKYDNDVLAVAKKLDVGKSTIYRMIQNGELKQK